MIESECCHSAFKEESLHWVSVPRSSAPVWNLDNFNANKLVLNLNKQYNPDGS
jgi:hypothetical protein